MPDVFLYAGRGRSKYVVGFTIVDEVDFDVINGMGWWHLDAHGYAVFATPDKKNMLLHVLVAQRMGLEWDTLTHELDHKNRDKLDNRRENLRVATPAQNSINRKSSNQYKGVRSHQGRWQARIKVNQRTLHLGMYDTPREAAVAYNAAAVSYFGEFAVLNEIQED